MMEIGGGSGGEGEGSPPELSSALGDLEASITAVLSPEAQERIRQLREGDSVSLPGQEEASWAELTVPITFSDDEEALPYLRALREEEALAEAERMPDPRSIFTFLGASTFSDRAAPYAPDTRHSPERDKLKGRAVSGRAGSERRTVADRGRRRGRKPPQPPLSTSESDEDSHGSRSGSSDEEGVYRDAVAGTGSSVPQSQAWLPKMYVALLVVILLALLFDEFPALAAFEPPPQLLQAPTALLPQVQNAGGAVAVLPSMVTTPFQGAQQQALNPAVGRLDLPSYVHFAPGGKSVPSSESQGPSAPFGLSATVAAAAPMPNAANIAPKTTPAGDGATGGLSAEAIASLLGRDDDDASSPRRARQASAVAATTATASDSEHFSDRKPVFRSRRHREHRADSDRPQVRW